MKKYIEQWGQHLALKKKAKGTIKNYTEQVGNVFADYDSLDNYEEAIENYAISIEKLKDTTIASRMYAITSFQEWLIKEGILDHSREVDIVWKYIPNKTKKKHVEILTKEQQDKLFSICSLRDELALTILLKTGIRISEFGYLDDINALINNEIIQVSGKSISSRDIFISKDIKQLAIQFKETFGADQKIWPISYSARDKRLKTIATQVGLQVNLHMFRATFATEWVYKGHSIIQLQQAMGHSSLSQLEPYIHSNQLELKRAWEEFTTGIDYYDVEFLKAENKYLKERLKKYE